MQQSAVPANDSQQGAGTCSRFLASGTYSCAVDFCHTCPQYPGYCNEACGYCSSMQHEFGSSTCVPALIAARARITECSNCDAGGCSWNLRSVYHISKGKAVQTNRYRSTERTARTEPDTLELLSATHTTTLRRAHARGRRTRTLSSGPPPR